MIDRLIENVERARENDDGSVVNRGLELLGKERGMFADRQIVGSPDEFELIEQMNRSELLEFISRSIEQGDVVLELPAPASNSGNEQS